MSTRLGAGWRATLATLLIGLTACGNSAQLRFQVRAQPEHILQRALPTPPAEAQATLSRSQRVVLDLESGCRAVKENERERCASFEAALAQAIRATGREVIVASSSELPALELARQLETPLVLLAQLPTLHFGPSHAAHEAQLEEDHGDHVSDAEAVCQAEVLRVLTEQRTHGQAELRTRWVDSESAKVLWRYEYAAEGEAATPATTLDASYERGTRPDSKVAGPVVEVHHDHDHHHRHSAHCGHRSRDTHHDDDDDDDDGAKLLATLLLTVLVVGIVVMAVSAQKDKQSWCTAAAIPALHTAGKQHLAANLDRALAERVAATLGPVRVTSSTFGFLRL